MMTLFNEEYILKTYVESEKLEAEKEELKKLTISKMWFWIFLYYGGIGLILITHKLYYWYNNKSGN